MLPGQTLLVHGGSSGIGVTAIQLVHAFGSQVIVTVGSEEKVQYCYSLGANLCINYKEQDFEEVLGDMGVDVILDMIGGSYFQGNLNILNEDGRLVHINAEWGKDVMLDIWQVMMKRLSISGGTLRGRNYGYKKLLAHDLLMHVWPLIEKERFRPVIFKVFSYKEVVKAHECMEQRTHIGKLVLDWEGIYRQA